MIESCKCSEFKECGTCKHSEIEEIIKAVDYLEDVKFDIVINKLPLFVEAKLTAIIESEIDDLNDDLRYLQDN